MSGMQNYNLLIHKKGATAQDGISDTMWKEQKDMTGELLSKVKEIIKL